MGEGVIGAVELVVAKAECDESRLQLQSRRRVDPVGARRGVTIFGPFQETVGGSGYPVRAIRGLTRSEWSPPDAGDKSIRKAIKWDASERCGVVEPRDINGVNV